MNLAEAPGYLDVVKHPLGEDDAVMTVSVMAGGTSLDPLALRCAHPDGSVGPSVRTAVSRMMVCCSSTTIIQERALLAKGASLRGKCVVFFFSFSFGTVAMPSVRPTELLCLVAWRTLPRSLRYSSNGYVEGVSSDSMLLVSIRSVSEACTAHTSALEVDRFLSGGDRLVVHQRAAVS